MARLANLSDRVIASLYSFTFKNKKYDKNRKYYLEYPFPDDIDKSKGFSIQQDCDKTPVSCEVYGNREHYAGFLAVPFEFTAKT